MSEVDPGHPGADLSALLDGELDPGQSVAVHDHLAGCAPCRAELDDTRLARAALRSLPGLDPPGAALVLPEAEDPRVVALRRRRSALVSVAASVALLALLSLGASGAGAGGGASPDTGQVLAEHAASVLALSEGGKMIANGGIDPLGAGGSVSPTTQPVRSVHGLPAPYLAPLRLDGGYALVEAFRSGPGLHLVYEDGPYALSVFETVGEIDFGALPEGGRAVDVAGRRGWRQESSSVGGRLVLFQLGAMTVTVAGDEPGGAVLAAARSIPEPRSLSLSQRVRRRCAEALAQLAG